MNTWIEQWKTISVLKRGFKEHIRCAKEVYELADEILKCNEDVDNCYLVSLGNVPDELFTLRRNLFSTLFQSVYEIVGISPERRHLYGQINQLNRIWVTSADNLLDNENNITLPVDLGSESPVMGNVVSVMTADRILTSLLLKSVERGELTASQAYDLSNATLQALLPSAAQEASEEMGVDDRPSSEFVLNSIHSYKTGVLFLIPFVGPDLIEKDGEWDVERVGRIKDALHDFGLGCQLLDDIRDLSRDFIEKRNNYLLSLLAEKSPDILSDWREEDHSVDDRLYREVPEQTQFVCNLARSYFVSSTGGLAKEGLPLYTSHGQRLFIDIMFKVLDLQELTHE